MNQNKRMVLKATQGGQKPDRGTVFNTIFDKLNIDQIRFIDTPMGYTALSHTGDDADQQ